MAAQVAGAASAICPQGPACWLCTRKKKRRSMVGYSSHLFLSCLPLKPQFALWYEYMCCLPSQFCLHNACGTAIAFACILCLTCQHAVYIQVHARLNHHGALTLLETARIQQAKSSWCQHVTCLAALLCWLHALFCSLWGNKEQSGYAWSNHETSSRNWCIMCSAFLL